MLLEDRAHIGFLGEVALASRVSAAGTGVNEEGQRLCAGRPLMKVCTLSAKRIGGNDSLRIEPIIANRTRQLDLSERRHRILSLTSRRRYRKSRAITLAGLVAPDIGGYLAARFTPPPLPALLRSRR
jgi:hypothetical protein